MHTILSWAGRSNAVAVANAQAATVAISRARVERGEVERDVALCLAQRRAERARPAGGDVPAAG